MCNEVSNLCANPILSVCVDHEGELGDNTKITSDCVNQSDVNADLYAITDEIIDNTDTSNLGALCITYPVTEGKILPRSVFETNETEICDLKTRVTELEGIDYGALDITGWNITIPECIADACGDQPLTLETLLQAIMTTQCA